MSGVAIAAAVVGAASTVYSAQQTKKAGKVAAEGARQQAEQQRLSSEAQGRQASVEAQRERIKQAREARIARGRVIASTEGTGIDSSSSGAAGAVGSVFSQAGYNVGNINQAQTFAQEASAANQAFADIGANTAATVAKYQSNAATGQAVGSIASSIFSTQGGFGSIFKGAGGGNLPGGANTPIGR